MDQNPEVWLRGPVDGVPPVLQPVAHALLQSLEEVRAALSDLTDDEIWLRPGSAAAIGFHVRHAARSLERLLTYARGEMLSPAQRDAVRTEGRPDVAPRTVQDLLSMFEGAVDTALAQLRTTPEDSLLDFRGVGRAQLPSNVLGLLFHAAEHTQRHMGQMVTTAKIVRAGRGGTG